MLQKADKEITEIEKEEEAEITIEAIRRAEELVNYLVEAAKECDLKMIHGYEELKKDLLGVFLEDLEEQIKDRSKG